MPKEKLLLMANIDNVFSFPQATIDAHTLDKEDIQKIIDTTKLFLPKTSTNFAHNAIKRQIDNNLKNFDFIRMKYPLPCSYNASTKRIVVNAGIWQKKDLLNVDPRDIYAVLVYSYVCAFYSAKPLDSDLMDAILDFMSNTWIKLFAKKYGLIGSYVSEIPKFRFLINLHTLVSFYGMQQQIAYKKAANFAKINKDAFDINLDDYDFYNTKDFIKATSDSGVLFGMSLHEFAATIIRYLGAVALPMFEDGMRFMATLGGSTVNSNTIFSTSISRYNIKLYERIIVSMEKRFK